MTGDYFLLDTITGWRTLKAQNLTLDGPQGMNLRSLPGKPEALADPAGTFGGMESPTGVVADVEGHIYVSDAKHHLIWRFEPCMKVWEPLPCLGGPGSDPRKLNKPRGLALSSEGDLYVADSGNDRVQAFNLNGLVLRAIWGKKQQSQTKAMAQAAPAQPGEFNQPWDVAVDNRNNVCIADKGNSRVQKWDWCGRHFHIFDGRPLQAHFFLVLYGAAKRDRFVYLPARRRLERWPAGIPTDREEIKLDGQPILDVDAARLTILRRIDAVGATDILHEWQGIYPQDLDQDEPFESPAHLAIDRDNLIYVVDEGKNDVRILDSEGRVLGRITLTEELAGRFRPSAIAVSAEGFVDIADRESRMIHRFRIRGGNSEYIGHYLDYLDDCWALAAGPQASLIAGSQQGGLVKLQSNAGFEKNGEYWSRAFDSEIERCQWHRVVLDFSHLQATNEGASLSGSSKEPSSLIPTGTSLTVWTYTSEVERDEDEIASLPDEDWKTDQTNAPDFLVQSPPGRYLWLRIRFTGNGTDTPILRRIKTYFPRLSSLQYLPAVYQQENVSRDLLDRFLSLTDTLFESLEGKVDDFARYLDAEGTPDSFLNWLAGWLALSFEGKWTSQQKRELILRAPVLFRQRGTLAALREYLRIYTGCDVHILEHYLLRQWLFLARDGTLKRSALWGHGIVQRLQLEENSRIGDFRLVSTGDPLRDPFHVYAHKFSVFIPSTCLDSEIKERTVRRLISQEKPAHTQAFLVKVEPRFRIGVQSMVGVDTIVANYPRVVLGKISTLGSDALLGRNPERFHPSMLQIGQARIGANTVIN